MSIRFRRSVKLIPGVRLNFNKDSVGMSFGVRGAHYTVNSKGRRTASVGIPGTGLYAVETLSSGRKKSSRAQESLAATDRYLTGTNPPKPGLFAGKAERALNEFLLDIYSADSTDTPAQVVEKAKTLRAQFAELRPALELISFLHAITDKELSKEATKWAPGLWKNRDALFADSLVKKYLVGIHPSVQISRGISTNLAYTMQTLGFMYVEVLQGDGKYDEALAALNDLAPDALIAISTADIELSKKDFDGAIDTTEDVENEDDVSAMLLIFRGIAFRGKGLHEAALECFKRALAKKDRSQEVLHRARFERADTYIAMGKKAMAIKDLEKILVDDPSYDGVSAKLASLR
ncbi:Tetratricopeptide repeat [Candidatus Nanopelagicaceae bacterium]